MNGKNKSAGEDSLPRKVSRALSKTQKSKSPLNKKSVRTSAWKTTHDQSDPSISFIHDVSTTNQSMLADYESPSPLPMQQSFSKSKQGTKKMKKSNKIFGFFKKIFKSKAEKKKKKKKSESSRMDESFLSSSSIRPVQVFSQTRVDFTKDEIFSNE